VRDLGAADERLAVSKIPAKASDGSPSRFAVNVDLMFWSPPFHGTLVDRHVDERAFRDRDDCRAPRFVLPLAEVPVAITLYVPELPYTCDTFWWCPAEQAAIGAVTEIDGH
jgi:hypothetical protein